MKNKRLGYSSAAIAGLSRAAVLTLATLVALCAFAVPWAKAQELIPTPAPATVVEQPAEPAMAVPSTPVAPAVPEIQTTPAPAAQAAPNEAIPAPAGSEAHAMPQGQIILTIDDQQGEYGAGPFTYVVPDEKRIFTPQMIIAQTDDLYSSQRNVRRILDVGYSGEKKWLVLKINNLSSTREWLLNFGNTLEGRYGFVKSIETYTYTYPRDNETASGPGTITKVERRIDKNIVLRLEPRKETLVMLAVESTPGIPLTMDMKIMTKNFAIQNQAPVVDTMTMLLLFLGGMTFFFMAGGMAKQSWDHLPYAGYYALLAIIFVWNNTSIFGTLPMHAEMLPILLGMLTVCSIGLTKIFLAIRPIDYLQRYLLNGLALAVFLGAVVALMPVHMPPLFRAFLFYGPTIATFLSLPVLCYAQAQAGKNEAYPLIWGWFFHVVGIIITAGALGGFVKLSGLTINAFWLMLVPQAVFFAMSTLKKMEREQDIMLEEKAQENKETLSLVRLRHTKESAEQSRLLKVIEREREILAQMREREIQRTEEMRLAKNDADEANRAKSAFLAVVSHEIRTPMTGIMGMVRLLLDTSMNKEQKDYVQTIQDSGDSMLTLLNDILDFEKIERGKMELESISFDLPRLIQGVATLMSGHAAHKNIGLKTHIGDDVPTFVMGDPNRLRQVLLNLCGNAIKFTSKGNVVISVESDGPPTGTLHSIKLSVQDSGIGISEEAQKNLFTPFSQADSSISRKFGGTGLGLAICKGLIEAMGSRIRVASEEDRGSTFYFTLKMQAAMDSAVDTAAAGNAIKVINPADARHVLVVDDNEINRKVVTGLLGRIHCTADTAQSAEQALQILAERDYDLILMDIQLPGMKGDEATQVIRKMDNPVKANIPVIALSGNVRQEDIAQFKKAGMSGFLAKPIDPEKLAAVIAQSKAIVGKPTISAAASTVPDMPPADSPQDVNEGMPSVSSDSAMPSVDPTPQDAMPAATPEPAPAAPAPLDFDETKVFDRSMLGTLKDSLGKDQLEELLDGLLDKTTEIVAALQEASEKQDVEAIAARAHELKGMAGNFGLIEISSIASEAEKKAREKDTADIGTLVSGLPDAKTRAQSALASWIAS